jgi:hypothetical protein
MTELQHWQRITGRTYVCGRRDAHARELWNGIRTNRISVSRLEPDEVRTKQELSPPRVAYDAVQAENIEVLH